MGEYAPISSKGFCHASGMSMAHIRATAEAHHGMLDVEVNTFLVGFHPDFDRIVYCAVILFLT